MQHKARAFEGRQTSHPAMASLAVIVGEAGDCRPMPRLCDRRHYACKSCPHKPTLFTDEHEAACLPQVSQVGATTKLNGIVAADGCRREGGEGLAESSHGEFKVLQLFQETGKAQGGVVAAWG